MKINPKWGHFILVIDVHVFRMILERLMILYLYNFSNPSQIGEKAGLSSAPISFLLLVFGFASLASEPSRGIQKNLSFLKTRRVKTIRHGND